MSYGERNKDICILRVQHHFVIQKKNYLGAFLGVRYWTAFSTCRGSLGFGMFLILHVKRALIFLAVEPRTYSTAWLP
jgi:hypothetical protein